MQPYYDIRDYGAAGGGGIDDTAAIQAAVDAAAAQGGGTVWVPRVPGGFAVTQLRMKSNVGLLGAGWSSSIKCINGNTADSLITNDTASAVQCRISNLFLNGNKANQDHPIKGVHWSYVGAGAGNELHLIDRVYVWSFGGVGVHVTSGSHACNLDQFFVYGCDEQGILYEGSDGVISHGQIGNSGLEGIRLAGWNNKLIGVKPFFSGMLTPSQGHGFHVAPAAGNNMLSCCEPQDNAADGYWLESCSNTTIDGGQPGDNKGSALRISGGHHHAVHFHASTSNRSKHANILKYENSPSRCFGRITYDPATLQGTAVSGAVGNNNIVVSEN